MKEGDVVRFTQFHWRRGKKDPGLRDGKMAWAVAYDAESVRFLMSLPDTAAMMLEFGDSDGRNWEVELDEDEFEVVEPDDWPPEVCAAMALRAMGVEQ